MVFILTVCGWHNKLGCDAVLSCERFIKISTQMLIKFDTEESIMKKIIFLVVFALLIFSNNSIAEENIKLSQSVDQLVHLLNDISGIEYKEARRFKEIPAYGNKKYSVVLFTIEGFFDGNNWYQFLAVFESTQKMIDPVTYVGEKKYMLKGYVEIAAKHINTIDFDSLKVVNRDIIVESTNSNGTKSNIIIKVNQHSLNVEKGNGGQI